MPRGRQPTTRGSAKGAAAAASSSSQGCASKGCLAVVRPFRFDPSVDWEAEATAEALATAPTTTGDFHDAALNVEFRRFLTRDVGPVAAYALAIATHAIIVPRLLDPAAASSGKPIVPGIVAVATGILCLVVDAAAFALLPPTAANRTWRRWLVMLRVALALVYLVSTVPLTGAEAVGGYTKCPPPPPKGPPASPAPSSLALPPPPPPKRSTAGCEDVISSRLLMGTAPAVALLRVHPVAFAGFMVLGYAASMLGIYFYDADTFAVKKNEAAFGRTEAIVGNALVLGIAAVVGVVFAARYRAVDRRRFVAAAQAEGARRLALAELRAVDALLKRVLPAAVVERVAAGVDVVDESDDVTVVIARVEVRRCNGGSLTQSRAAEAATVGFLHRVVSEFDEHLASGAGGGVSKVKTVGDVYWAVAGLPEAVACHASAACRFAVGMHATAAQVEDGSGRGELRAVLRVGVHSGSATGAMLGTQRLSYEPFGPACDGARVALRRCAAGTSLVTDGVKRRLGVEARQYAGDVDSEAMFATEGDVDAALEVQEEVGSGAYVLYELPGAGRLPGAAAVAEALVRQLRDDAVSVRSRSVGGLTAGAAALAEGWVSEAMRSQRAQLEQRLGFLLARAAEAEGRRLARLARRESRYRQQHGGASRDDEAAAAGGAAGHDFGIDAAATEQLAALEDPEEGPFAPGSRVPLVYTFADAEEERGYLDFARDVTHVMRRDVRIGTAVLYWACCVFFGATSDNLLTLFVFIVAGSLATLNAGTLVLQALDHADTALGHAAFAAFVVALYMADGHVLGNDPFWVFLVYTLTLFQTTWTLSPLARSGLSTLANVAAFAKMAVLQKGLLFDNFSMFFAGVVALPVLYALSEKYSRRAYVERRLAEALLAQQGAAQTAQRALLGSIVPPAFARPLQRWFAAGCRAEGHLRQRHEGCPIAALSMQPMVPTAEQGQAGAEWLLEAHRALDALLDRCTVVEKVKTAGDAAVLLWGPGERALMSSADDDTSGRSSSVSHGRTAHSATPGMFAAELLFVVRALEELRIRGVAAMHVGDVTGAVVGTERVSLDVLGQAVGAAEAALEAAVLAQAIVGHGARANNAADPTHDHVGPGGMVTVTQEALGALLGVASGAVGYCAVGSVVLPAADVDSSSFRSHASEPSTGDAAVADRDGCALEEVAVQQLRAGPGCPDLLALRL